MTASLPHIKAPFVDTNRCLTKSAHDYLLQLDGLIQQALIQAGESGGGDTLIQVFEETIQQLADDARSSSIQSSAGNVAVGGIILWTRTSAPSGWLLCDGAAVERNLYSGLFSLIGTTYGAGNGLTTFNVPDLRDRYPLGATTVALGSTAGANVTDLSHAHDVTVTSETAETAVTTPKNVGADGVYTSTTAGSATYDNRPASLALNFIIKY